MAIKRYIKLTVALLACLLFVALPVVLYNSMYTKKVARERVIPRGNILVMAIDSYYKDHMAYPPTLNALVPMYIKIIPRAEWGIDQWTYDSGNSINGKYYDLAVYETEEHWGYSMSYSSDHKHWTYHNTGF